MSSRLTCCSSTVGYCLLCTSAIITPCLSIIAVLFVYIMFVYCENTEGCFDVC